MFIGLMGIDNDGTLVTPSGRKLFKAPEWVGIIIQRVQHEIAKLTWK